MAPESVTVSPVMVAPTVFCPTNPPTSVIDEAWPTFVCVTPSVDREPEFNPAKPPMPPLASVTVPAVTIVPARLLPLTLLPADAAGAGVEAGRSRPHRNRWP